MNHNLTIRLLIILLFCDLFIPSYAQSQSDQLENIFNRSEIRKLNKGDQLIDRGRLLYPGLDTILNAYSDLTPLNLAANRTLLHHASKYDMQSTVRATRTYYSGVLNQTNIYIKRLKRFQREGKDKSKIGQLINKHLQVVKNSRSDFNKSRNCHYLEEAVMWSAIAINRHKKLQQELYQDLAALINEKPSQLVAQTATDTLPKVQSKVQIQETDTIKQPVEIKEEVTVPTPVKVAEKPIIKEEPKPEIIKQPETYFSIQVMADKKKAVASQLTRVYNGKRKIMLHEGDGWYRYSVGKFKSVAEASSTMKSENIKGFVVAYSDEKRITISQAKTILNTN